MKGGKERKRVKFSVTQDGQVLGNETTETSSRDTAEKDTLDYLESRVVQLRQETYMLSRELKKLATECMHLNDANAILEDELRQMYGLGVIKIFEAINPENNPNTDEERDRETTVTKSDESSLE